MTNKIPSFAHPSGVRFPSMTHSMIAWMHRLGRRDFILYDPRVRENLNSQGVCKYCGGKQVIDSELGLARCICAVKAHESKLIEIQAIYQDYVDPVHFSDFKIWGEDVTQQALQDVVSAIQGWMDWPDKWMTLIGAYGCGKSMLLQIVANYYGPWAMYVTMESFSLRVFDYLRSNTLGDFQTALARHPILVLDDPGSEYQAEGKKFVRDSLSTVIKLRYGMWMERPLVVATNKSASELRTYHGLIADRLLDRDKVIIVPMDNIPSYRKEGHRYVSTDASNFKP